MTVVSPGKIRQDDKACKKKKKKKSNTQFLTPNPIQVNLHAFGGQEAFSSTKITYRCYTNPDQEKL